MNNQGWYEQEQEAMDLDRQRSNREQSDYYNDIQWRKELNAMVNIGDIVKVNFIGTVTQIAQDNNGNINYTVKNNDAIPFCWASIDEKALIKIDELNGKEE